MKQIRIFCRTAHTYGSHKNKTGFDTHNLRKEKLKPEHQNYIPDLSKNNVIYDRNGKTVSHNQLDQLVNLVKTDTQNKIKASKNGMSQDRAAELNLSRSKTKTKIRKWSEQPTNKLEMKFFSHLLLKIGNEKINAKQEIKKLSELGKIKRFNNKSQAIQDLEKANKLLDIKDNSGLSYKAISTEKLFKIPDQWNINVKPEDWNKIFFKYHKKYFSNFDKYYTAVHCDENPDNPHAHFRMSGFNRKSQSFDLPDYELNLIRRLYKKPDLFNNKKWSKLDTNEIKKFGEMYQTFMFAYLNKELNKLGYSVKAIKKTEQEIKKDQHIYSNKKIRQRNFNGVNKLNDKKAELVKVVLDNKKSAIQWNTKAKEQKSFFNKFQNKNSQIKIWLESKFENWFSGIVKFKKSGLEDDLLKPVNLHLELEEQKIEAGNLLKNEIEQYLSVEGSKTYHQQLNKRRTFKNTP